MRILDFERSCNKTLGSSRKYICLDSKVFGYEMGRSPLSLSPPIYIYWGYICNQNFLTSAKHTSASTRHIQAWETKGKMKWTTALSDIILLPILLLISIPLALSASITTGLALIMLLIRALVVYFELSIALLANFFFFPAHSPTSGSFLALTEGNTPSVERTTPYARAPKYSSHVGAQQTGFAKSRRESWSSKEGFVEDYFSHHNHSVRSISNV